MQAIFYIGASGWELRDLRYNGLVVPTLAVSPVPGWGGAQPGFLFGVHFGTPVLGQFDADGWMLIPNPNT